MDPSWTRSASPAHTSRLPTKKKSSLSMRDVTDSLDRLDKRALATSPSAISDTSSGTDYGHHDGNNASRRSSTSSQQSQLSSSDKTRGRTSTGGPGQTRIPRPSPRPTPSQRPSTSQSTYGPTPGQQQLSIKDAYRMAQEEEAAAVAKAAQGSPSPAPRPWRTGGGSKSTPAPAAASGRATPASASESRMQKILAQSPLDIGGRRTARRIGEGLFQGGSNNSSRDTPSRLQRRSTANGEDGVRNSTSHSSHSRQSSTSHSEHNDGNGTSTTNDLRRIRYEEDQARMQVAMGEKSGGLFSPKARVSPKIAVAGRELHRRASNTSLGEKSKLSEKSKVPVSVSTTRTTSTTGVHSALATRGGKPGSYLKRMVSAPENVTQTSVSVSEESEDSSAPSPAPVQTRSATVPSLVATQTAQDIMHESPGKSFAWDADEDFTANDLMTSESPRVTLQSGLDIDEARSTSPSKSPSKSPHRPRNTKLDEIRRLELEADLIFPDESGEDRRADDEILPGESATNDQENDQENDPDPDPDPDPTHTRRHGLPAERTNKTLDEIRAREEQQEQPLSKRALSAIRLEEIRQQNAGSRPKSFDAARKLSQEHLRAEAAREAAREGMGKDKVEENNEVEAKAEETNDVDARAARDRALFGDDSEQIPNTPITIYRTSSTDRGRKLLSAKSAEDGGRSGGNRSGSSDNDTAKNVSVSPAGSRKSSSSTHSTHSRTESQELLRKLARVTTSVVAAAERKDDKPLERSVSLKLPRSRDADTLRPTVGFAQLRRQPSTESASTKRSSLAQSDGDPTDRIEAEMKLFAAGENHSERGSIRAPSPDPDDEEDENLDDLSGSGAKSSSSSKADEATPRPNKLLNPLMQPTPRVTGAYVETPVTARNGKILEVINGPVPVPAPETEVELPAKTIAAASSKEDEKKKASTPLPGIIALLRGGDPTDSTTAAEGPSAAATTDVETRFRRLSASRSNSNSNTKSKSRSRSRSASRTRTPLINSAKPASARDDLLAIQRDQQIDDSTIDDFDEILATHTEVVNDKTSSDKSESESRRRMSQSVSAYLIDMHMAKKSIEKLEDQFSNSNPCKTTKTKQVVEKDEKNAEKDALAELEKMVKEEPASDHDHDLDINSIAPSKAKQQTKQHKRQGSSVSSTAPKKEKEASVTPTETPLTVPATTTTASHIQVPVPRLHNNNKQLTLLGVLVLLLSMWFAAESTACAFWCRPQACQSGQACQWSPDDPSFGAALPVKLDQWLTGGQGRVLAAWATDELGDLVADAWDAATGTDIRDVDSTYFTFEQKRRHRRRLQKRILVQPWTPPAEARPKLEAWRRAREAREQERRAREELGYSSSSRYDSGGAGYVNDGVDDDGFEDIVRVSNERMMGDEKVGSGWW
ncbi:hypothetical protein Sste5346_003716 [Sporothrix stenoceras]|uniref:Uncharacterized protein n=1 Tax=Sporothrix stenoceras TaxID=5173 RepID=A0ABR3ZBB4_9PEZI